MNILGISSFFHDSAAVIVNDKLGIVAAAEEERFSRKKHDHNFPTQSIEYCLAKAGIIGQEVDIVAFYEEPWTKINRVVSNYIRTLPKTDIKFREVAGGWINQKLWVQEFVTNNLGIPKNWTP